jgi:hypothetical protein
MLPTICREEGTKIVAKYLWTKVGGSKLTQEGLIITLAAMLTGYPKSKSNSISSKTVICSANIFLAPGDPP